MCVSRIFLGWIPTYLTRYFYSDEEGDGYHLPLFDPPTLKHQLFLQEIGEVPFEVCRPWLNIDWVESGRMGVGPS